MKITNFRYVIYVLVLIGALTIGSINNRTMKQVELASGLGVEKVDDQYVVSLQIFNPAANKKDAQDQLGGFTYTQSGKTVPEAIQKIRKMSWKKPILDTLQVVVLGEKLLKEEGLTKTIDFLIRDTRIPANVIILTIKDYSPDTFFHIFTKQQKLSSLYASTLLHNTEQSYGRLIKNSPERLKSILVDESSGDVLLPYLMIVGDIEKGLSKSNIEDYTPSAQIEVGGFSVFKEKKLHSYFTSEESNTIALIYNINQVVSMSVNCPGSEETFTMDTIHTGSNLKVKKENTFDLKIKIEGNVEELSCTEKLPLSKGMHSLEKQLEKTYKEKVDAILEKTLSDGLDILRLKDTLYRQDPKSWKQVKENKDYLSTVKINTNVEVSLVRTGHIGL